MFMKLLKFLREGVTEITISQLASGAIPPRRGKKSTDKDKRIQGFSENTITLEEYVQGIQTINQRQNNLLLLLISIIINNDFRQNNLLLLLISIIINNDFRQNNLLLLLISIIINNDFRQNNLLLLLIYNFRPVGNELCVLYKMGLDELGISRVTKP